VIDVLDPGTLIGDVPSLMWDRINLRADDVTPAGFFDADHAHHRNDVGIIVTTFASGGAVWYFMLLVERLGWVPLTPLTTF
jgi:hypothetical protein